ncbi:hypothetical protein FO519_005143 [Halicephalobus sp. NKZ332]|nr:hypothetical protein FO519_005143 [Halicephalobus sp. NKZ332]
MTFQAANVDEARWLYDQLTPITPIFLALSAATPIFRGYLSDVDSRWDVISASVDDRTREERRLVPLKNNKFVIKKSRYDTTDCYIHPSSNPYNDIELEYDLNILQQLLDGGIDEYLARHIAHIFIRDPLHVIRESIEQEDEKSTDHFETILTSNWNNIRFKPPPQNNPQIGWRVEFRPTEVQLTDFENTAYCCDGQKFPGLVSLILQFLDEADFDTDTKSAITRYLSFVRKRASGEICTLAHWIRAFVAKHPSYEKDSYVNDEITYDMLKKVIFIYLVTEH